MGGVLKAELIFGFSWAEVVSCGVTDEMLIDIVVRGEILRDSATRFDPPTRAGFDAWAEKVRAAREHLVPLGWDAKNPDNYPTVVSPCGRIAIGFATGNAATGTTVAPMTNRPIGPAAIHTVETNQLDLLRGTDRGGGGPVTWLLVTHRVDGSHVRAELSLPSMVDDSNHVVDWYVRHIVSPIDLGSPSEVRFREDDALTQATVIVKPR